MLIRYQTTDGETRRHEVDDPMGTPHDEEDQGVAFLQGLGAELTSATFYRYGVPFWSFTVEPTGLRRTNP